MRDDSRTENEEKLFESSPQQVREMAEARARTVIAEAEARASALVASITDHAQQVIDEQFRSMSDLIPLAVEPILNLPLPEEKITETQLPGESARTVVSEDELRHAIAVRAYYKSAQRGFWPGHDTEDWLEAEQEVLSDLCLN